MVYEESTKVYCCCGQYIVPTKAVSDKKLICPRCEQTLVNTVELPKVIIVKKN